MKSSLFLVATSALLASAGPMRKRELITEWVEEVVATVFVYEDGSPVPATGGGVFVDAPKYTPPVVVAPVVSTTTSHKPKATPPPPPPPAPKPEPSEVKIPEAKSSTSKTTSYAAKQTAASQAPKQTTTSQAPKQTATSQPPASNLGDYEKTILDASNLHRQNHSAAALVWDETLAQYAANTANGCVFEHDMKQGGGGYGQNLASKGSSGNIDSLKLKSAAEAVSNQWYNGEAGNYNFFYGMANPPTNVPLGDYGHFTQLVWKSTQKVGCATVKCPSGTIFGMPSWYTVCNYQPAGNFGGEYGRNVLKPLGLSVSFA